MIPMALFFAALGILIKHGRMYFLIAGYNTMSKEEKAKVDIEGIATLFRNVMLAIALLLCAGKGAAMLLGMPAIESLLIYVVPVSGVIYLLIASNSKKYTRKS